MKNWMKKIKSFACGILGVVIIAAFYNFITRPSSSIESISKFFGFWIWVLQMCCLETPRRSQAQDLVHSELS